MDELDKKFEELATLCGRYKIDAVKVRDEIADSMETANKVVKTQSPESERREWWALWWVTFMQEWSYKCFARFTRKCRESKDYQEMQNLWLSDFEPLWLLGCDIARIDRLNNMTKGFFAFISHMPEPIPKTDEEMLWQWFNAFDEAALKAIDFHKEKQRQVITKTLKQLKEYDEASLLGKLKRLLLG